MTDNTEAFYLIAGSILGVPVGILILFMIVRLKLWKQKRQFVTNTDYEFHHMSYAEFIEAHYGAQERLNAKEVICVMED